MARNYIYLTKTSYSGTEGSSSYSFTATVRADSGSVVSINSASASGTNISVTSSGTTLTIKLSKSTAFSAGTYTGSVTVSARVDDSGQQSDLQTTETVTFTLAQAQQTLTASYSVSPTSYTYSGTQKTPTVTTSYCTASGDLSGTNAGTYTITFTLNSDTSQYHYQWSDGTTGTKTATWTISKATRYATYSLSSNSFTYNGDQQGPTISTTYCTASGATSARKDVGTYTVTFTKNADTQNYTYIWSSGLTGTAYWQIVADVNTVTMSTTSVSRYYSTGSFTRTASSKYGGISYTSSNTSIATVNSSGVVTFVGIGTVSITATSYADSSGNGNYTSASKSYSLTISREAVAAPTLSTGSKVYNGTAQQITTSDFTGWDSSLFTLTCTAQTNVSSSYIARVSCNTGYEFASPDSGVIKTYTWSITQATNSIASFSPSSVTWYIENGTGYSNTTTCLFGDVSYSSSNTSIALVDSVTGDVSFTGTTGQVTIYASSPSDTSGYGNYAGVTNGKSYTITVIHKTSITKPTKLTDSLVWNGSEQTPDHNTSSYYTFGGQTSGTAIGTYSAYYRLNNTTTTMWSDGTTADIPFTWYITKRVNTITWNTQPAGTYVGLESTEALSASATYGTVTYRCVDGTGSASIVSGNYVQGISAGTVTIYAEVAEGTTYEATSDHYTFTVYDITVVSKPTLKSSSVSVEYDTNSHTVTTSDFESFNSYAYSITTSQTGTNVGQYSVVLTCQRGYQFTGGSTTANYTWQITQAVNTVTAFSPNSLTVYLEDETLTKTTSCKFSPNTVTYSSNKTGYADVNSSTGVVTFEKITNAGQPVTITATSPSDTSGYGNYVGDSKSYTLTIVHRTITPPTLVNDSFVYDGSNQQITTSDFTGYDSTYYSLSSQVGQNVDTYSVTLTIYEAKKCVFSDTLQRTKVYSWSITKATPYISFSDSFNSIYVGQRKNLTATTSDGRPATITSSASSILEVGQGYVEGITAGYAYLTATSPATQNYNAATNDSFPQVQVISRVSPTYTAPTVYTQVDYTGSSVSLLSSNGGVTSQGCTMYYYVSTSSTKPTKQSAGWVTTPASIVGTSRGRYYVWYRVDGSTDYGYTDIPITEASGGSPTGQVCIKDTAPAFTPHFLLDYNRLLAGCTATVLIKNDATTYGTLSVTNITGSLAEDLTYSGMQVTLSASPSKTPGSTATIYVTAAGNDSWKPLTESFVITYFGTVTTPTWKTNSLTYNATAQSPNNASYWNNYQASYSTISGTSQTNAGNYTATCSIINASTNLYAFDDLTPYGSQSVSVEWTIDKADCGLVWMNATQISGTYYYDTYIYNPQHSSALIQTDAVWDVISALTFTVSDTSIVSSISTSGLLDGQGIINAVGINAYKDSVNTIHTTTTCTVTASITNQQNYNDASITAYIRVFRIPISVGQYSVRWDGLQHKCTVYDLEQDDKFVPYDNLTVSNIPSFSSYSSVMSDNAPSSGYINPDSYTVKLTWATTTQSGYAYADFFEFVDGDYSVGQQRRNEITITWYIIGEEVTYIPTLRSSYTSGIEWSGTTRNIFNENNNWLLNYMENSQLFEEYFVEYTPGVPEKPRTRAEYNGHYILHDNLYTYVTESTSGSWITPGTTSAYDACFSTSNGAFQNIGNYTGTLTLLDTTSKTFIINGVYSKSIDITWSVIKKNISIPTGFESGSVSSPFVFNNSERDPIQNGQSTPFANVIGLSGTSTSLVNATASGYTPTTAGTCNAINANTYSVIFSLADSGVTQWSNGSTSSITLQWKINPLLVPKPTGYTPTDTFVYDGSTHTPFSSWDNITWNKATNLKEYLSVSPAMGTTQTNVNTYNFTFSLNTATYGVGNLFWHDGSSAGVADGTDPIALPWYITKMSVVQPNGFTVSSFTYDSTQKNVLSNGGTTYANVIWNGSQTPDTTKWSISGNYAETNANSYTTVFTLADSSNTQWDGSAQGSATVSLGWKIQVATKSLPTFSTDTYSYDGTEHNPLSGFNMAFVTASAYNYTPSTASTCKAIDACVRENSDTTIIPYRVQFELVGNSAGQTNVKWSDGTTTAKYADWYIERINQNISLSPSSVAYTLQSGQRVAITIVYGSPYMNKTPSLTSDDSNVAEITEFASNTMTILAKDMGSTNIRVVNDGIDTTRTITVTDLSGITVTQYVHNYNKKEIIIVISVNTDGGISIYNNGEWKTAHAYIYVNDTVKWQRATTYIYDGENWKNLG